MSAPTELVAALMQCYPQLSHGQRCPVWLRRTEDPPPWSECDCFLRVEVNRRAGILTDILGITSKERQQDGCQNCEHWSVRHDLTSSRCDGMGSKWCDCPKYIPLSPERRLVTAWKPVTS